MNIDFCGPAVPASDGGISYKAIVDSQTVACKFSLEALEDFDPSNRFSSAIEQFENHQSDLLGIAEKKILNGQVENSVVHIFSADVST